MTKPILISGIQPTGKLHIGNYLGALKNFVELQDSGKYQCYFFIADLHSLTEDYDPKEKKNQILELMADFLAAGLDPSTSLGASPTKSVIFLQSQIPAHSELAWILNTITSLGELRRMTQFKEKSQKELEEQIEKMKLDEEFRLQNKLEAEALGESTAGSAISARIDKKLKDFKERESGFFSLSANAGLFDYPVLMAADILMYNTQFVPVGDDQDQHLELTRTLARKFNARFGKTFVEPKGVHTPTPRVMSLTNPLKKMSKSEPSSCLFIDDLPEDIENKIKRAVTDSGSEIKYDKKNKPALSNLLEIYSSLSGEVIPALEKKFQGKNYAEFKNTLSELITQYFADFRKTKKELVKNPDKLLSALTYGSKKAALIANKKIAEVKEKVGLI